MSQPFSFIDYLRSEQPEIWESIKGAAAEGLILIDETNDAVSATNRLLLTYPDLHAVLNLLVDSWIRTKSEDLASKASNTILAGEIKTNG